jgi:hypothetical protein
MSRTSILFLADKLFLTQYRSFITKRLLYDPLTKESVHVPLALLTNLPGGQYSRQCTHDVFWHEHNGLMIVFNRACGRKDTWPCPSGPHALVSSNLHTLYRSPFYVDMLLPNRNSSRLLFSVFFCCSILTQQFSLFGAVFL